MRWFTLHFIVFLLSLGSSSCFLFHSEAPPSVWTPVGESSATLLGGVHEDQPFILSVPRVEKQRADFVTLSIGEEAITLPWNGMTLGCPCRIYQGRRGSVFVVWNDAEKALNAELRAFKPAAPSPFVGH